MTTLLQHNGVSKHFGGVSALHEVTFGVERGKITGLIGPNGAGKTTLFNVITGVIPVTYGRIFFEGKDITGLPTHLIAKRGIVRTFQNVNLFSQLSARENIMVGMHCQISTGILPAVLRLPMVWKAENRTRLRAEELLEIVGLKESREERASNLPFGHQRLLEVARALAAEPRLLLLDEPAAGLNREETTHLSELLFRIRDSGMTIFLVEHDVGLVMDVSEKVVVLDFGVKIAEGSPSEVQEDPAVRSAYLGRKRS
jgi:branched-chain amino acid transport system ATP-binding protein